MISESLDKAIDEENANDLLIWLNNREVVGEKEMKGKKVVLKRFDPKWTFHLQRRATGNENTQGTEETKGTQALRIIAKAQVSALKKEQSVEGIKEIKNNQEAIRALLIAGTSINMDISQKEKQVINDEFTQIDHSARTIKAFFYKHCKQKREITSDQIPVNAEGLGQSRERHLARTSSDQNSRAAPESPGFRRADSGNADGKSDLREC